MEEAARKKWMRVAGLCVVSLLLMLSYALARPATESLFLEAHTSARLPWVWLLVAGLVVLAVVAYNRFVCGRGLLALYAGAALASSALLAALVVLRSVSLPGVHYLLYAWKDVYVVVLVEAFYAYTNTVFEIRTARWVYGLFGAAGSLGGIGGNLVVGQVADRWGSVAPLWMVVGILALTALVTWAVRAECGDEARPRDECSAGITQAARVVGRSRYLLLILAVVAFVQVAVTLIDYQFNVVVESAFPDVDTRTGVIGKVYATIAALTVVLNASVGVVLRLAGVPATLLFVPIFVAAALTAFAAVPRFLVAAVLKIASKCLDYTIFRAAKEILYIPLGFREKTMGKSIADMLTYRVAKGGASVLLLLFALGSVAWLALPATFAVIFAWTGATWAVARRFRSKVSRTEEIQAGAGKARGERAASQVADEGRGEASR